MYYKQQGGGFMRKIHEGSRFQTSADEEKVNVLIKVALVRY